MKQTRALYCLTLGFIHGARLDKTYNYEAVNEGYYFKAAYTPITFVKLCDINQPLHKAGQTYLFGFSPHDLFRIASLTKKDLEDALTVELNWVNTTRKKIQSGWEKVSAAIAIETQAVEREKASQPAPPTAPKMNAAEPATAPMMVQEETPAEPPAAAPEPAKPTQGQPKEPALPIPEIQAEDAAPATQDTGTVTRGVLAYNVYVASAKVTENGSLSVGYSAFIKNLQTGEITEFGKGGYTKEFGKMIVLALREAFDSGIIPPSTKTSRVLVTVYTSNEYIANMFAKNLLRSFATKKDWKKADGTTILYRDEWEGVWNQVSHLMTKGVLCEASGEDLKACTEQAQNFAEEDYKERYALIGPGGNQ